MMRMSHCIIKFCWQNKLIPCIILLYNFNCSIYSVSISKRRIFEEFQNLVTQTPMDERPLTLCNESSLSSYNSYKQASINYQLAKKCFLTYFSTWQRNDPQYEEFEL